MLGTFLLHLKRTTEGINNTLHVTFYALNQTIFLEIYYAIKLIMAQF